MATAECCAGRSLTAERVWALEDSRDVSVRLERAPLAAGERVLRVPPKLIGVSRRGEREASYTQMLWIGLNRSMAAYLPG